MTKKGHGKKDMMSKALAIRDEEAQVTRQMMSMHSKDTADTKAVAHFQSRFIASARLLFLFCNETKL